MPIGCHETDRGGDCGGEGGQLRFVSSGRPFRCDKFGQFDLRQGGTAQSRRNGVQMGNGTYNRDSEIEAKASAHLPGLDIDIIQRQSPNGDWEQVSINLRATPSFEAVGRLFEIPDPLTAWMQAARLMWMPWLLTAQTMMLPCSLRRTLPNTVRHQQETPTSSSS